jgi:hypothetical protein
VTSQSDQAKVTRHNVSGLIAPLCEGPLDVIGDVHGEIEVLNRLLAHLGYDEDGYSHDNRKLAFLGDLIDRGPDSPAVLDRVMAMCDNGTAQCLMGNHELNILINRALPGNGWFVQPNPLEEPGQFRSNPASEQQKEEYLQFLAGLPLVLEHEGLRLVHACWHAPSVERLRHARHLNLPVSKLYEWLELEVGDSIQQANLPRQIAREKEAWSVAIEDRDWPARMLPAHAQAEILGQMANPLRVLTTGRMGVASGPFFAAGRWRMSEVSSWWDDYDEEVPVVIGHFWRQFDSASKRVSGVWGRDVFEGVQSHAWLGKRKNVYCVDYSVGQLHLERRQKQGPNEYHGKLAALRFPEWEVHHDDGIVVCL